MERIREARRMTMAAAPNGLSRRRQQHHHRTNGLRDSPEDDGAVELQDAGRFRDRGSSKRDRDPDRDRERERDRERDRLTRSKRRRGERMMHGSNREDGGDDSSEESVNDDDEEEDEDGGGGGPGGGLLRMLPPNPVFSSTSSLLNHRKSFPPPTKVLRPASTWKTADEMIGVSVPRKARSASTKRSHDCWASGGGIVGEQIHRQASTSPARPSGASAMGIGASQSPLSPSSSNTSVRKKIKSSNGAKFRPPKSGSKSSSSAQDEIEIEIAEVLYGMMRQPQGPTKQEIAVTESIKFDCKEANNKSSCDAKSRVSSPISNSQSAPPPSSSVPQNSGSSITAISAVVPKRKRPRTVNYDEESPSIFTACSPISPSAKAEIENQLAKIETSAPNFEKTMGSAPESGSVSYDAANSQASEPHPEPVKLERAVLPDSKSKAVEPESRDSGVCEEKPKSPKKDSLDPSQRKSDDNREEVKVTKAPTMFQAESHREDMLEIDLMAPPPLLRSSPERDGDIDFVALEAKPVVADAEMVHEVKPLVKEDEKGVKVGNKSEVVAGESEKARIAAEETESQRPVLTRHKERNIDLQLDLEKTDRDSATGSGGSKKLSQNIQRHQQPNHEKNALSNSLPLQMSVHSWPGLPTMGYMAAPLQGVVSMDGSTVSSAVIPTPHLFFNQPRPKRCATHCYIARNISYHQQIARMNPFWPAAAGSASLYPTKACNTSVIPSSDPHNSISGKNATCAQEKGTALAMFPAHFGKEKGPQAANMVESTQRKQILLQQSLPHGAPSNILHGPAFIFPLHQQQAAAAASVCPGALKSSSNAGSVSSSATSSTPPVSASVNGPATAPAMSFSYPNIPGSETQYLAFLQNNAYPFPIPAHVGAPPAYRGTHPQALPFFNGSFYPSQIIHPSQLQPQQQPQPPQQQQQLPAQSQHSNQGRQSTSFSSGSSSSQKHLQNNQHQKPNAGSGSLQSFPLKNQSLQQQQQRQPLQNHHIPYRAPQMETDNGREDNPATDGRFSRTSMSLYGQNFAIPMQPANFALMTSTSVSGTSPPCTSANEKKQQQSVSKTVVETSQAFAIPFAPINGSTATPAIDLSSIQQNHLTVKSHGYQMMAAAVAQQKKTYVSEEVKAVNGDSSNVEDERKAMGGKIPASIGQSIAFSRSDITNPSTCAMPGNTVIDSSSRSLNLGSASGPSSSSVGHAALNPVYVPTSQQQLPINQQQQQQILHLQKNQQFAAVARSKISTSNGSVYTDHLPSTPATTNFPATASHFQIKLEQNGNPSQSAQWKNSGRAPTSKPTSPSMPSAPSSSAKAIPQLKGRPQQTHMQISFASNSKPSAAPALQPSASNQSPSPPIMVGSPTTSSLSKSAGGSPRTTSSSTSNKFSQASSLSSQQVKNSQSVPSSKSSPVGGRNVSSILGSPHLTPTPNTVTKSQVPQQQQQPHISKQALQQAQLFFSNAYLHPQTSQSSKRKDVPKN